jgi:hypothetical protein
MKQFLSIDTIPFILYGVINQYIKTGGIVHKYIQSIINYTPYAIVGYNIYQSYKLYKLMNIGLRDQIITVPNSDTIATTSDKKCVSLCFTLLLGTISLSMDILHYYIAIYLGSSLYSLYTLF